MRQSAAAGSRVSPRVRDTKNSGMARADAGTRYMHSVPAPGNASSRETGGSRRTADLIPLFSVQRTILPDC